jgi:hypothetical protein
MIGILNQLRMNKDLFENYNHYKLMGNKLEIREIYFERFNYYFQLLIEKAKNN